jgi:PadR family transcriptional regulator, regulatory protein PadR
LGSNVPSRRWLGGSWCRHLDLCPPAGGALESDPYIDYDLGMRISHQTKRVLVAFLDAPEEETYGFALSQATGLGAGTLYPVLQRLLAEGWLESRWEDIDQRAEGRRRRRYYKLTSSGRARAEAAVRDEGAGLRTLIPGWGNA